MDSSSLHGSSMDLSAPWECIKCRNVGLNWNTARIHLYARHNITEIQAVVKSLRVSSASAVFVYKHVAAILAEEVCNREWTGIDECSVQSSRESLILAKEAYDSEWIDLSDNAIQESALVLAEEVYEHGWVEVEECAIQKICDVLEGLRVTEPQREDRFAVNYLTHASQRRNSLQKLVRKYCRDESKVSFAQDLDDGHLITVFHSLGDPQRDMLTGFRDRQAVDMLSLVDTILNRASGDLHLGECVGEHRKTLEKSLRHVLVRLCERSLRFPAQWILSNATHDGNVVALKVPRLLSRDDDHETAKNLKAVYREVALMRSTNHTRICPVLGVDLELSTRRPVLVLPWTANGNVGQYLQYSWWCQADAIRMIFQIVEGLEYLHDEAGIVHGDLHPGNILLDGAGDVRLTDFGRGNLSDAGQSRSTAQTGAIRYMAPEVLFPDSYKLSQVRHTPPSDMYSFGQLAWQIYTRQMPFPRLEHGFEVLIARLRGECPESQASDRYVFPSLWNVMTACWHCQPLDRISASEACQQLYTLMQPPSKTDWRAIVYSDSQNYQKLIPKLIRNESSIECLIRTMQESQSELLQLRGHAAIKILDILDLILNPTLPVYNNDMLSGNSSLRRSVLHIFVQLCVASERQPSKLWLRTRIEVDFDYGSYAGGSHTYTSKGMSAGMAVAVCTPRVLSIGSLQWYYPRTDHKAIALLRGLRHAHIISIIGVQYRHTKPQGPLVNPRTNMVFPWMANGNVEEYLTAVRWSASTTMRLNSQVIAGLSYLHEMNVVHGNLNPDNILVDSSGHIKLCGFSYANFADSPTTVDTEYFGHVSTRFSAPEKLHPDFCPVKNMPASDIYSLGRTAWRIYSGRLPFPKISSDIEAALHVIVGGVQDRSDSEGYIPDTLWSLMERCWQFEPSLRPSISECLATCS
ncbi:kinase-like protein [Phanerochaete sordida]|uniref:Kinase-like protein n=1 Tax=Phanerochaete sordida TaxID=48140 RepID=A0A9P3GBJ1_9APHY|nr:kinase-like protein [Phanerochaete sordida]